MRLADFFAATGGPPRPLPDMRRVPPDLRRMLLTALALAVVWWLAAALIDSAHVVPVWNDQRNTFTRLIDHLRDPFELPSFNNPPWTAWLMAPFGIPPVPVAVLLQLLIYFPALALIVYRFGGGPGALGVALTSFVAFLAAVELNVDWLVCLGLLVPAAWSGPLLLVKPQLALGAWLGYPPRKLLAAGLVAAVVGGLSLLIWGWWPPLIVERSAWVTGQMYNMAPMALLGWYIALPIAALLGWFAFRRRDPVLGIFAWLFVVPYIAPYSLLLAFTLLAVRRRRLAALISVVMWIIYGGALILGLLLAS